jgi:nitric oxide reductase large subunit
MDTNTLLIWLLFGCLGTGFFMYGKNTHKFVPLGVGVALMIIPYFIANLITLSVVCAALSVLPFIVHES